MIAEFGCQKGRVILMIIITKCILKSTPKPFHVSPSYSLPPKIRSLHGHQEPIVQVKVLRVQLGHEAQQVRIFIHDMPASWEVVQAKVLRVQLGHEAQHVRIFKYDMLVAWGPVQNTGSLLVSL